MRDSFKFLSHYHQLIVLILHKVKTGNQHHDVKTYMPTFPICVGFSQFEVVKKANPDIPIGIAKTH
jgi:hypothetical protein